MMRFLQTLSSQPVVMPRKKSGLIIDLQRLEREMKSERGRDITNENLMFKQFVDTLDCILINGLKEMRAAYWPVVHPLLCKSTLSELCLLLRVKTSLGRSRAWLFRGFNDQLLSSYLNCLLDDRNPIEQFYNRDAVLYSKTNLLEVINILRAVEQETYTFRLEVDCAYFDNVNWLQNEAQEGGAEEIARDATETIESSEQVEIHAGSKDQHVAYYAEEGDAIALSGPTRTRSCVEPNADQSSVPEHTDSNSSQTARRENRAFSDPPCTGVTCKSDDLSIASEDRLEASATAKHGADHDSADRRSEQELFVANRDQVSIASSDLVSSTEEHYDEASACVTTLKSRVRGVKNRKHLGPDLPESTPTPTPTCSQTISEPETSASQTTFESESAAVTDSFSAALLDAPATEEPQSLTDCVITQTEEQQSEAPATETQANEVPHLEVAPLKSPLHESTDSESSGSYEKPVEPTPQIMTEKTPQFKRPKAACYATELPHEAKLFLELNVFTHNERCEYVFSVLNSFLDGDVQPSWLIFTNRQVMTVDKLHRGAPVDFSNRRSVAFSSLSLADVQCVNTGLNEQWLAILTKRRRVAATFDTGSRALTLAIISAMSSLQSTAQNYSEASVYELILRKHICHDCNCPALGTFEPTVPQCRLLACQLCFLTQLNTSPAAQDHTVADKRGTLYWRKFYVDANQAAEVRSGGSSVWNALAYSQSLVHGALETVRQNPTHLMRSLRSGLSGLRSRWTGTNDRPKSKIESPRNGSQLSDASSDTSDFVPIENEWNVGYFTLQNGDLLQFAGEAASQHDLCYSVAQQCIGCQIDSQSDEEGGESTNTKMTCLLQFREESGPLADEIRSSAGQIVCLELKVGDCSDAVLEWHSACLRTVLAGQSGLSQPKANVVQRNATACALVLVSHADGSLRMHFLRGNRILHDYRTLAVVDLSACSAETSLTTVGNNHLVIAQVNGDTAANTAVHVASFLDGGELTQLSSLIHREVHLQPSYQHLHVSALQKVDQDTLADIHPVLTLETVRLIDEHLKKYGILPS